jgi:hypothetical protein
MRRGQFLTTEFLLEIGGVPYHVVVERGRVVASERGPFRMRPWRFAIRISAAGWARFCQPEPPPGYQDLFGLIKHGEARVEGDLQMLMAHLRYLKDLLALCRQPAEGG